MQLIILRRYYDLTKLSDVCFACACVRVCVSVFVRVNVSVSVKCVRVSVFVYVRQKNVGLKSAWGQRPTAFGVGFSLKQDFSPTTVQPPRKLVKNLGFSSLMFDELYVHMF